MLSRIRPSRLLLSAKLTSQSIASAGDDNVEYLDDEVGLIRLYSKLERGDIITALMFNSNQLQR